MKSNEETIQACYSTWGETYYEEYYGQSAAYPPVHRTLLKRLLHEHGAKTVLDAGCGPASFLRDIVVEPFEVYGFDLTPEMVQEAKRVISQKGVPESHIWQGSVLSRSAYTHPETGKDRYDSVICIGVLPHILQEEETNLILNLRSVVPQNGLVVIEARNQLFSLFTLNRYSYEFFLQELIHVDRKNRDIPLFKKALCSLQERFCMDIPPLRQGKKEEPGYDEVLSRTHNPLVLEKQFKNAGFKEVQILFYHYHCLPPMFEKEMPEAYKEASLALEDPFDWRGYFLASAFLLAGKKG